MDDRAGVDGRSDTPTPARCSAWYSLARQPGRTMDHHPNASHTLAAVRSPGRYRTTTFTRFDQLDQPLEFLTLTAE